MYFIVLLMLLVAFATANFSNLQSGRLFDLGGALNDCNRIDECKIAPGDEEQICGTNGKTFRSKCDFLRVKCKEGNVEFKNFGPCSASEKCLGKRRDALREAKKNERIYIPTCEADGTFTPVQCHPFSGYCWCVYPMGTPVTNIPTTKDKIKCDNYTKIAPTGPINSHRRYKGGCHGKRRKIFNKNMIRNMVSEYERDHIGNNVFRTLSTLESKTLRWKFHSLDVRKDGFLRRSETRGLRKIVRKFKPKKCARKFPKLCDQNHDKKISLDEWMNCFVSESSKFAKIGNNRKTNSREKTKAILGKGPAIRRRPCEYDQKQTLEANSPNAFVPKCNSRGFYRPVQCYGNNVTNSWYCFCVHVQNGSMIANTYVRDATPNCSVLWPNCPPPQDKEFLKALRSYFVVYAKTHVFKKNSFKALSINEDNVIQEIFDFVDKNNNKYIEGREKRTLRKMISKKNRRVWVCGRRIHIVCDTDADSRISLQEFLKCVSYRTDNRATNDSFQKKSKINPFIELIQSEDAMAEN